LELFFATTNRGKFLSLEKALDRHGIRVKQVSDLDVPEIQHFDVEVVAAEKAKAASTLASRELCFARERRAVLVNDAAFCIDRLSGFPGTYVKHVTALIGLDGFLRLMAPWVESADRACGFKETMAFHAPWFVEPKLFCREVRGRLSSEVRDFENPEAKGPLWKLFIPDGFSKTLAEMTPEELAEHRFRVGGFYDQFADWLCANRHLLNG
jgi:non-canonical purine NTP pyrophosphatase (RdgB/HAM1 family)